MQNTAPCLGFVAGRVGNRPGWPTRAYGLACLSMVCPVSEKGQAWAFEKAYLSK